MSNTKPKVIKDFDKLSDEMQEQIKLLYPEGFSQNLITFTDREGKIISALPFETEDKYYMIRMTPKEAKQVISDDDDYEDDGLLKDDGKGDYEDKYSDLDYMAESEEEAAEDDEE